MANNSSTLLKPNPAMERGFAAARPVRTDSTTPAEVMTLEGTLSCAAFLLGGLVIAGAVGWVTNIALVAIIGFIAAFVIAIVTTFKPHLAQKTGLVYALLEGYALGWISRSYNEAYDGIVVTAIGLTLSITAVLLAVYRTGRIKPSQNFRLAVAAATGGIALLYVVSFVVGMFGGSVPLVNSSSGYGILFSLFVVALASANLVLDFDFIERGVESGAPKYMEWFGAFALMVTIVWLYLEILRLLAKLRER